MVALLAGRVGAGDVASASRRLVHGHAACTKWRPPPPPPAKFSFSPGEKVAEGRGPMRGLFTAVRVVPLGRASHRKAFGFAGGSLLSQLLLVNRLQFSAAVFIMRINSASQGQLLVRFRKKAQVFVGHGQLEMTRKTFRR